MGDTINPNILNSFVELANAKKTLAENMTRLGIPLDASASVSDLVTPITLFYRMGNLRDGVPSNSVYMLGNNASAINTIALGDTTTASGRNALTSGYYTIASAKNAVALGDTTTASGSNSLAVGYHTIASEFASIAAGSLSEATKEYAIALGVSAKAHAYCSFAIGRDTLATGRYTFVSGYQTQALSDYKMVGGLFNQPKANTLFEIGNGSSSARHNAFEVYKDGRASIAAEPTGSMDITNKSYVDQTVLNTAMRIPVTQPNVTKLNLATDSYLGNDNSTYYISVSPYLNISGTHIIFPTSTEHNSTYHFVMFNHYYDSEGQEEVDTLETKTFSKYCIIYNFGAGTVFLNYDGTETEIINDKYFSSEFFLLGATSDNDVTISSFTIKNFGSTIQTTSIPVDTTETPSSTSNLEIQSEI